jgi:two-component system NtrC family sensor kinase
MRVFNTISFRLFAGTLLLLLAGVALYSDFCVRYFTRQMTAEATRNAYRLSDFIKSSTYHSMLLNRKEDVYRTMQMIAREPGVVGIRIFNKRGMITFSTNSSETGKLVDLHAEACYACHERGQPLRTVPSPDRMRIYPGPQGYRVLGMINPVRNEPSCSATGCHAEPAERTVLGVLDVRMSLQTVDGAIQRARRQLILTAVLVTLATTLLYGLFLLFTVRRPIRLLTEGTRQVAAGNLEHDIRVRSNDDLGQLARSFNAMTRSLRRAEGENRRWAETLEERVRVKSEELQRANERMFRYEKMASLGQLAATVAHELNNPLAGVLTYAKLLAKRIGREGVPDERRQEVLQDLDLIVRETQRCGNIVNNLLLFSKRGGAGHQRVLIHDVFEHTTALVQHLLSISNVTLQAQGGPEDLSLVCDGAQLEQALVALLVNAAEAMPGGGTIHLVADRDAERHEVRLGVSDTGVGISKEDLPHIFEPFFTTKKEGKGVGLGLSIVYGIVERHGGTISVQSEPGHGTTFEIRLPEERRTPVAAAPAAGEEGSTPTGRGGDPGGEQA